MLKYMLLSDSHRASGWLSRAAEVYARGGFDGVIHLGDVHSDAKRFAQITGAAPLCVRGNCDLALCPAPAERVEVLGGVRFFLTHGDRYGVKSSLTHLSYRAEELACRAALFGHTHSAFCGYMGGALLLNPGALRDGNFAEMTVEDGRIIPRLLSL